MVGIQNRIIISHIVVSIARLGVIVVGRISDFRWIKIPLTTDLWIFPGNALKELDFGRVPN